MQKTTRIALLAAAALALPAAVSAQQTTPEPAQPAAPAQAAPANEAQQLQQKLGALQQRAMQDPSLKAATDSFNAVVQAGMAKLDPQAPAKVARAAAIPADVTAARAANDNAKLNALATESSELQSYFTGLRQRAIQLPEVATARQAYIARLFAKMKEYDPQAQAYVDRLSQLSTGNSGGR